MKSDVFYVYLHRRLSSGVPFYVGKGHGGRAWSSSSRNSYWKNIVAKDGGRDVVLVIENIDEELAFLAEVEAIDKFRRIGVKLVNQTDGGDGPKGRVFSEEAKLKMRAKRMSAESREKMRAAKIGKPLSDEHRKKLSDALKENGFKRVRPNMKGFVHSAESRARMSAAMKGRIPSNKGVPATEETMKRLAEGQARRTDFSLSEETKKKISASRKGKKASPETLDKLRKCHLVPVVCVETGEVFESATAAALHIGLTSKTLVTACCTGRRDKVRGFTFRHAEKRDERT